MTAPASTTASPRRALVFGGSGTVGAAVLQELRAAGVTTTFTYRTAEDHARGLAAEHAARAVRVDLRNREAIRGLIAELDAGGEAPSIFIHCAAVTRAVALAELTDDDWGTVMDVGARAAFVACQALAPIFARSGQGQIVLVGAMDRTQSLPMPVHFAASQGTLAAMTMALAKELGPAGTRVNMVALGVLEGGISRELRPELLADYKQFSALRRVGAAREAARAIAWLALSNRYMSGQVVPVNGGI